MKRITTHSFFVHLILSFIGIGCSSPTPGHQVHIQPSLEEASREESNVYDALLAHFYVRENTTTIVVLNETSFDWLTIAQIKKDLEFLKVGRWKDVDPDVVTALLEKAAHPFRLKEQCSLKVNCLLISKEKAFAIGRSDESWKQFFAKYPGQGIITLSRIGFSHDGQSALVYTGDQSGGRSGKGRYVFLTRGTSGWMVQHEVPVWSS